MAISACSMCGGPAAALGAGGRAAVCDSCRQTWRPDASGAATIVTHLPGRPPGVLATVRLDDQFRSRFQLEEFLGAGATSTVYAAREVATGRAAAIKFVAHRTRSELIDLLEEARLLRQLEHENVLRSLVGQPALALGIPRPYPRS